MATLNAAAAAAEATEAIKEHFTPALDAIEENVREAKRAIVRGRHAAEDLMAATALEARRHPLRTIGLAAGVGALAGCLVGFACGSGSRRAHD